MGGPLGLGLHEAAAAIVRVATENMVGAIEEITINQGIDPRGAVLVGGGGAAGLNSVAIARRLGCTKVVIPELGAALSAAGAIMSDLHAGYRALHYAVTDNFDVAGVNRTLAGLLARCRRFLEGPGTGAAEHSIDVVAEARYRHQIWEIDVPIPFHRFERGDQVAGVREAFHRAHEEIFGFGDPGSAVEFVGWRATVRCRLRGRGLGRLAREKVSGGCSSRKAYFGDTGWWRGSRVDALRDRPQGPPSSNRRSAVVSPGARCAWRSGSDPLA